MALSKSRIFLRTLFFLAIALSLSSCGSLAVQQSSSLQRDRADELLRFISNVADHPEYLTLENVTSRASANFGPPFCITRPDGVRRCIHTNAATKFDVRLNNLDTFSLTKESDKGARVTLEINPAAVCVERSTLLKIWNVAPVKVHARFQDFFPGSTNADKTNSVEVELYTTVARSNQHVFLQAQSVRGCVITLELSAIPPSTFGGIHAD